MSKRILITGAMGFIGHHLVDYVLTNTDWDIVTLDRLDFSGNMNRLFEVVESHEQSERQRIKVVYHDLKAELNPQIVNAIGQVDYIAHLAAGSHVDRSIEAPLEFVMDNVVGTANILEFARKHEGLEKFVYFSTDEVFGPAPVGVNYQEFDRHNPTNPYAATKSGGEMLTVAYQNTYKLPAVVTHVMNVFGERQHPEKFIPMCIRKARDGEVVTIHSNSAKTIPGSRFYIHAEDVASALCFILEQETDHTKCQKYNIVGPEEINNLELATIISDIQNKGLLYEMVDFHSSRPGHDLRYALDGSYMKSLGWEPKPVRERLKQVVLWSLENNRWLKV